MALGLGLGTRSGWETPYAGKCGTFHRGNVVESGFICSEGRKVMDGGRCAGDDHESSLMGISPRRAVEGAFRPWRGLNSRH
jgi:hypothetical protein